MKRYADTSALADHLRVAPATVRAWVRLLDIPVIRVGRLVRFDVDAVEQWYENGGPSRLADAMRLRTEQQRRSAARVSGGRSDTSTARKSGPSSRMRHQ